MYDSHGKHVPKICKIHMTGIYVLLVLFLHTIANQLSIKQSEFSISPKKTNNKSIKSIAIQNTTINNVTIRFFTRFFLGLCQNSSLYLESSFVGSFVEKAALDNYDVFSFYFQSNLLVSLFCVFYSFVWWHVYHF